MLFKRYFPILIFFLQITFLVSQNVETKNISLKWNDNSSIQVNKNNTITLPLVEDNFFNQYNLPTYSTTFNVQNNLIVQDYQIKNVKLSNLSKSLTKNINFGEIPTKLKSTFKIGIAKNKSLAKLILTPLIKENNQIKKIISFTLEYRLQPKNNLVKNKIAPIPIYTSNSVLASGSWYKFSIDTTGVFKIDKQLLQKIGINTTNLNPNNIKIYGNGGSILPQLNSDFRYDDLQENAIYIEGDDDGIFDNNDFILFYAKGPDSWKINTSDFSLTKHQNNIYSDKAYYFITIDNGTGKRISASDQITLPSNQQINNYQDFLVHEIEKVNLFANGQQWLGEDFSFNENQTFRFNFNDIDNSEDITLRIRGVAISFTNTQMNAKINGVDLINLNFPALSSSSYNLAVARESFKNTNSNQEQLNIEITYNNFWKSICKSLLRLY